MITRHKINARVVLFDDAEVPNEIRKTTDLSAYKNMLAERINGVYLARVR